MHGDKEISPRDDLAQPRSRGAPHLRISPEDALGQHGKGKRERWPEASKWALL